MKITNLPADRQTTTKWKLILTISMPLPDQIPSLNNSIEFKGSPENIKDIVKNMCIEWRETQSILSVFTNRGKLGNADWEALQKVMVSVGKMKFGENNNLWRDFCTKYNYFALNKKEKAMNLWIRFTQEEKEEPISRFDYLEITAEVKGGRVKAAKSEGVCLVEDLQDLEKLLESKDAEIPYRSTDFKEKKNESGSMIQKLGARKLIGKSELHKLKTLQTSILKKGGLSRLSEHLLKSELASSSTKQSEDPDSLEVIRFINDIIVFESLKLIKYIARDLLLLEHIT
eukprot:GHVH01003757.1.p1 GENE.GHVH01003757.1~~GHVH01003757.1.p1  ORF type:complete len:286 (+),score=41.60 GHVH01003757.1:49-906(+)